MVQSQRSAHIACCWLLCGY